MAAGDDLCSDLLARSKASWEERECAPKTEANIKIARCPQCERHYKEKYLEKHIRVRHGAQQQRQQHQHEQVESAYEE